LLEKSDLDFFSNGSSAIEFLPARIRQTNGVGARVALCALSGKVPALRNQKPTWTRAAKLAREWQLNRLAERLDALA
jgi:hypothetical protein